MRASHRQHGGGHGSPKISSLRDSASAAKKCENRRGGEGSESCHSGSPCQEPGGAFSRDRALPLTPQAHHHSLPLSQPEGEWGR